MQSNSINSAIKINDILHVNKYGGHGPLVAVAERRSSGSILLCWFLSAEQRRSNWPPYSPIGGASQARLPPGTEKQE